MELNDLNQQIINDLIDETKPLNAALLKTKFLANRLQNEELLNWVNGELEGYQGEDNIPDYRLFDCQIEGDFVIGNKKFTNHAIPTIGLDDDSREYLEIARFRESISTLEALIKNDTCSLTLTLSAEDMAIIQDNWLTMSPQIRQVNLYGCRKRISVGAIHEILNKVRSKLLDFIMEIDTQFGSTSKIDELKKHPDQITKIMNKTIIKAGDGNVINTGNNNTINATITVSKGNQEELVKYLHGIGLSQADTEELIQIIDTDNPDPIQQRFGSNVNDWLGRMYSKALSGTWEIAAGAAGSLLASGIQNYYGW